MIVQISHYRCGDVKHYHGHHYVEAQVDREHETAMPKAMDSLMSKHDMPRA
jgi:hypothetical protein